MRSIALLIFTIFYLSVASASILDSQKETIHWISITKSEWVVRAEISSLKVNDKGREYIALENVEYLKGHNIGSKLQILSNHEINKELKSKVGKSMFFMLQHNFIDGGAHLNDSYPSVFLSTAKNLNDIRTMVLNENKIIYMNVPLKGRPFSLVPHGLINTFILGLTDSELFDSSMILLFELPLPSVISLGRYLRDKRHLAKTVFKYRKSNKFFKSGITCESHVLYQVIDCVLVYRLGFRPYDVSVGSLPVEGTLKKAVAWEVALWNLHREYLLQTNEIL